MGNDAGMGMVVLVMYFLIFVVALIGSMITAIIMGALTGAAPLVCGLMTGKKTLGIIGFIVCIAAYWLLGSVWSLVASLIFIILILKDKKNAKEPKAEEAEADVAEVEATAEDFATEE